MQKKRMLITGVSGLLGNNLAYCLKDKYEILGVYHTHRVEIEGIQTRGADLIAGDGLRELISKFKPDIIIHCAAQADVEVCEENPQEAEKINVFGTRKLMSNMNGLPAKLIFISTDLVYDGEKGNYSENDALKPLNHYGVTKRKAEEEVFKNKDALVLRTNFFGWNVQNKHSLGEWVIHELTRKIEIKGFTDSIFSTMYTFELAKVLDAAIQKNLSGIYNCASSTSMSKFEFVSKIAERLDLDRNLIKPITIEQSGLKAKRGKNLSLNISKLARDLSREIPTLEQSIDRFVGDFKKGIPDLIKVNRFQENIYPALLELIPYGRQAIDDGDIAEVVEVLKAGSITQGSKIPEFESALCLATGAAYAVAVNSGTSALHIACMAAGIGPGDEVITSPNTFVASANCVVYCQGKPVFADIDPRTYNISPAEIERKMSKRTRAVIPVHFAGQSADMESIQRIVRAAEKKFGHKIFIIEDACHALGSRYKETKVGSCAYSDMAVLSFHPVKHITTGEGGAVLTNDKELQKKLRCFRSHGITSDPEDLLYKENAFENAEGKGGSSVKKTWYYEQNCLGFNYRITDIQCALGISQLKKLEKFRRRRREIISEYNEAFKGVENLQIPYEEGFCDSNFHLYVLQFDFDKIGISRARLMAELKERGIQTQVHYIPVPTQPFYRKTFGTRWEDCPQAEQYYQKCLSIPLYPVMTQEDVRKVISEITRLSRPPHHREVGRCEPIISKIGLGTVQFGQDYGIANKRGKVSKSEATEILDYARSAGIRYLDTAFAYGDSETVLGEYLKVNPNSFKIVSKCPPLEQYSSGNAAVYLEQSLERLGIKKLYGYLIHRSSDIFMNGDLGRELARFKKIGKVEKIGFSLYSPDELLSLLDREIDFDIVQVPYSIFDRRFEKYFDLLKKKGKEIQVRSVFLQGLAFLNLHDLPDSLERAKPQLENLRQIARDQKMTPEALCLNFVLINRHIDKVIIGVDSLAQVKSNVASISFLDQVREIQGQLDGIKIEDEDILLPYKWATVEDLQ